MKKTTKFGFKTLLVFLLTLTLAFATTLAAACGNGNDSSSTSDSSSSTEENYPTDYQQITNGDFEFSTFKTEAKDFPVSSSIGWTLSRDSITSSAPSSKTGAPSGIVDTAKEAYDAIASDKGLAKDGDNVFNPGTPYSAGKLTEDGSYIYSEDVENEDGLPTKGTKILMIHNETSTAGEGTAQKFTSTKTLSLAHNEFAVLSVWVNTHGLTSKQLTSNVENVDTGAYIMVQNTVSSSCDPFVIKNINTEGEWVNYTVYLASSDFSSSSFKVVLGLGFGSTDYTRYFVEGFAYFDNITYKTIDRAEFEKATEGVSEYNLYKSDSGNGYVEKEAEDLVVNTKTNTEKTFLLSHKRANVNLGTAYTLEGGESKVNEVSTVKPGKTGTVKFANVTEAYTAYGITADEDKLPGYDGNALFFNYEEATSMSYTTKAYSLNKGEYIKLTYWVKAKTEDSTQKALTVTLNDYGTHADLKLADSAINKTTIISDFNSKSYENENYNGWCEYNLLVSNTAGEDETATRWFTLTFDFGTTDKTSLVTDSWALTKGAAIVTEPVGYALSKDDYSIASSNDYFKKVALSADQNATESEENDSYNFAYGAGDKTTVLNGGVAANVKNYDAITAGENETLNYNPAMANVEAGLFNSKYNTTYTVPAHKNSTNKYVQPLVINNKEAAVYGFAATSSATVSANSSAYISVDVYVEGDAVAYIYLADSNALKFFEVLAVSSEGYDVNNVKQDAFNKQLAIKVTSADCNGEWVTVRFFVTAGDNSISYRPEFWNGSRDGESSKGVVCFDNYSVSTSTDFDNFLIDLDDTTETEKLDYTRQPLLVKQVDAKGNDKGTYYHTYSATTIYTLYGNANALYADFTTLDAETETTVEVADATIDTDSEDSSSSSSSSVVANETSFNWALQLTSIIIAAVLIILLIVVLIKMLVEKNGSKKRKTASYYDRDSREKAHQAIQNKKVSKALKAEQEEEKEEEKIPEAEKLATSSDYDYDNPENNIVNDEPEATDNDEQNEENATEENNVNEENNDNENNASADENTNNDAE